MNKYSIISAIAIVVIIISVSYGVWEIYAVEKIQLRTTDEEFSYFGLSSKEEIEICNPLPFYVSFNQLEIEVYYQGDPKGIFKVEPTTLEPNTSKIIGINFSSDNFSESQYIFMHMDGEFSGSIPIRLDPNKMMVTKTYETLIIGLIPYQTTVHWI
ncbi:MAG: thr operon leader peptide [Nitrosopumilaceae archaeon]